MNEFQRIHEALDPQTASNLTWGQNSSYLGEFKNTLFTTPPKEFNLSNENKIQDSNQHSLSSNALYTTVNDKKKKFSRIMKISIFVGIAVIFIIVVIIIILIINNYHKNRLDNLQNVESNKMDKNTMDEEESEIQNEDDNQIKNNNSEISSFKKEEKPSLPNAIDVIKKDFPEFVSNLYLNKEGIVTTPTSLENHHYIISEEDHKIISPDEKFEFKEIEKKKPKRSKETKGKHKKKNNVLNKKINITKQNKNNIYNKDVDVPMDANVINQTD